jgi:DNA polymerase III subunit epsilon
MKLLVVDTETGGTDPAKHSILTLGAVVWDAGAVGESTEVAVWEHPQPVVVEEAMQINGLQLDELKRRGLPPKEAVIVLDRFLEQHFGAAPARERIGLVGHNLGFDVGFLKRLYGLAGRAYEDVFSHRGLDTASVIRFLHLAGRLPLANASLDQAIKYFKLEVASNARHTARADALVTAELLNRLLTVVHQ